MKKEKTIPMIEGTKWEENMKNIQILEKYKSPYDSFEEETIVEFKYNGRIIYDYFTTEDIELGLLSEDELKEIALKQDRFDLNNCSEELKNLVNQVVHSEMGFIDEISYEECEKLTDEVCSYSDANNFIDISVDDVVAYGGIIRFFVF